MTTSKGSFISFVVAALLASNVSASEFSFTLTPKKIQAGQRALLTLSLEGNDSEENPSVLRDELISDSKDFVVLDRTYRREGNIETWTIALTGYKAGNVAIPPVEVSRAGRSFSSERTEVEITSDRQPGDDELRPEFDTVSPPLSWKMWFAIFSGLAALYFGLNWIRKRAVKWLHDRKNRPKAEEPALEWLQRELGLLRNQVESGLGAYEISTMLSRILREYFARTTSNPVQAWTTAELREKLMRDPAAQRVLPILQRCDELHFGPEKKPRNKNAEPSSFIQETEKAFFQWVN